jgi:pimeloyl-ACP methyl ester carboxylesterase
VNPRFRARLIPALVALSVFTSGACTVDDKPSSTVRFAEVACPADVAEALPELQVTCGYLTVPQRHADPEAGTIDVFVARVRGADPVPADPLIVIGGKDIGAPVHYADDIAAKPGRVGREVIVLEPRGAGHGRPALTCPEIDRFDADHVGRSLANDDIESAFTAAVTACAGRLRGGGVDPGAFTVEESAADVEDLATALRLDVFNVEAIGYNSKIALDLLRRSPEGLRSVYLDSPIYPDQTLFGLTVDGTRSALEAFGHACDAQPTCRSGIPSIPEAANEAIAALHRHPLEVPAGGTVVELDGTTAARTLRDLMSFAPGTAPTEIADLAEGDVADIAAYIATQRPSCFGYRSFCRMSDPSVPWGEVLSILCREVRLVSSSSDATSGSSLLGVLAPHPYLDACQAWPVSEIEARDPALPSTDVPILLLHGDLDPYSTPPDPSTLATLSHAYNYVLVGQSTNPLGRGEERCAQSIRSAFVADPSAPPDSTCLASLEVPTFTP